MKGFICSVCGFISIDGQVPEACPACGASRSAFEEKEDAIKTPKDAANLSELEKKHIPVILLEKKCGLIPGGCTDVHVKIGEIQHPMTPEHRIDFIDFYIDKKYVSRVKLTPEKLNPAACLHLKANGGRLTAVDSCNLHGSWINEVDL